MTQQPPPPSWGGPPSNSPPPFPQGPPPPPPAGLSNKAKFWIGVAVAIPAMIGSGVLTGVLTALADNGGNPGAASAVGGLVSLLILAGFITLIVLEKTRWVALGMLAGGAAALILAAGACLVLIASFANAYG